MPRNRDEEQRSIGWALNRGAEAYKLGVDLSPWGIEPTLEASELSVTPSEVNVVMHDVYDFRNELTELALIPWLRGQFAEVYGEGLCLDWSDDGGVHLIGGRAYIGWKPTLTGAVLDLAKRLAPAQ